MRHILTVIAALCVAAPALASGLSEDDLNDAMCEALGGEREVRHYYDIPGDPKSRYVIVDCETDDLVIEGGRDTRSSLDSLQQAVFFGVVSGKTPAVVIYDTDGEMGPYEFRILEASGAVGVLTTIGGADGAIGDFAQ